MEQDNTTLKKEEVLSRANSIKSKFSGQAIDLIINGSIFLIFLLTPLFFTGKVAQGIGFEKMMLFYFLTLIGVIAWVIKGFTNGELEIKRTPLDIPILIFLGLTSISTLLSVNSTDSLIGSYGKSIHGLASFFILSIFYYLLVNNSTKKKVKIYLSAFFFSSMVAVVYALFQIFGKFPLGFLSFTTRIDFNTIGSISGLAMFIIAILPIAVVAAAKTESFFEDKNKKYIFPTKMAAILSVGILLLSLLFLSGFAFLPAAMVSIVVLLMFFLSKVIKIDNNNVILPLFVFLALIFMMLMSNVHIFDFNLPSEVSLARSASWDIAKNAVKENPVFGSGPSTFYYNFSKFKDLSFNNTALWNVRFDSASGIFFEFLSDVGILGTLVLIVLVLVSLSMSFISLTRSKDNKLNSVLLAFFSSFLSVVIYSSLFTVNDSVLLLFFLISVLGISLAILLYPDRFSTFKLSFRSAPNYALALAAIFLTVSAGVVVFFTLGFKMYVAELNVQKALTTTNIDEKIVNFNKAIELFPYRDDYFVSLSNVYMAKANQETVKQNPDTASIQEYLALAITAANKAIDMSPNRARNREAIATVYENAAFYTRGALEWSETHYEELVKLDPQNPTPSFRLALINIARANEETDKEKQKEYIEDAITKYDEAISKKPGLASAYYGKSVAYEKLNDIDEAIESLKSANLYSSGANIDYTFELGRMYFNRGVSKATIKQTASKDIVKKEIESVDENGETVKEISIEPEPTPSSDTATIEVNDDLKNAEMLFLGVLQKNQKHANALYSLAILYQKTGNNDATKMMVQELLKVVDDATKTVIEQQFTGLY